MDGHAHLDGRLWKIARLDFDDGHFFQRWDGDIIFSGHHCHRWFSNGFVTFRPSLLNVFFPRLTIGNDGFSIVFQILGTMVINGLDHGKRAILSLFRLLKFSNSSSVQLFWHIESILSIL